MANESNQPPNRPADVPRPAPARPQPAPPKEQPQNARPASAHQKGAPHAPASENSSNPGPTRSGTASPKPQSAEPPAAATPKSSPRGLVEEVPAENEGILSNSFLLFAAMPSWLVSMALHIILILLLTLLYLPTMPVFNNDLTIGRPDLTETEITNFEESASAVEMDVDVAADASVEDAPELPTEEPTLVEEAFDAEAATMAVELSDIGFETADSTDLMQEIGAFTGSGLEGRTAAERTRLVREAGGTEGSEEAVKRALQWIKRHQSPDGGWNFYHLGGACSCKGHGALAEARIGATALALLPYLGAGNTHEAGNYKAVVKKGLYFLLNSQKANGSLHESGGSMYSHGLASIVLCEAYAMTGDRALMRPAQGSLNFIAYAQDPITKGWRYDARDASGGDTSVVGWQLMALKSGHMSGLQVSSATVAGTSRFLNSVQANDGATYGYMAPGQKAPTTAIGLLCRMYLGWEHDHPPLVAGIKRLSKSGPSEVNLYYNYYATQTMRHFGGEPWEKWNKKMRDFLVKKQSRKGHADGSWYMGKEHTDKGGRLYCTAMATMILEVYYRHLPIYGAKAAQEDFQL